MKATFSFNIDQYTRLSDGITHEIRQHCGFCDICCAEKVGDQWHITFTSRDESDCLCNPVDALHYLDKIVVAGEIVSVTWVSTEEDEETEDPLIEEPIE